MTSRAAANKPGNAFGDGTGPMARRNGTMLQGTPPNTETRLIQAFVLVSALVHVAVIFTTGWQFAHKKITLDDETEIAADLVNDFDSVAPPVTSIPDAAKAEEAKVPVNMLPQLAKNFTISEPKRPEDAIAEEKDIKPAKAAPEEKKAEKPPEPVKEEDDQKNHLSMKDAMKRLALERLRQEQKTAKELEAPAKDPLAALADKMAKEGKLNKGPGSAVNGSRAKKYYGMLREAIHANYSLPEVYRVRGASWKVLVNVAINEAGQIEKLDVEESSGDATFDSLMLDAVRASVPLPKPPPELVGEMIPLNMTP